MKEIEIFANVREDQQDRLKVMWQALNALGHFAYKMGAKSVDCATPEVVFYESYLDVLWAITPKVILGQPMYKVKFQRASLPQVEKDAVESMLFASPEEAYDTVANRLSGIEDFFRTLITEH